MSSEIKTLVIFDTNALRQDKQDADFSYTSLTLNDNYTKVKDFIERNNLTAYIKLAVPKMVLEELVQQKTEMFRKDIQDLEKLTKIFNNFKKLKIELPQKNWSYEKDLKEKFMDSLNQSALTVIDFPKKEVLEKLIKKVIKRERPFKCSGNHKDYGFKDAIIWESILNFEKVNAFEKIFFITNDDEFMDENCINEFNLKFNKRLGVIKTQDKLLEELARAYNLDIFDDDYLKFAKTEYFTDKLKDYLKDKKSLLIRTGRDLRSYEIVRYEIKTQVVHIESEKDEFDEETGNKIIESLVEVIFQKGTEQLTKKVKIKTHLDEIREILSIESSPELN